MTAVAGVLLLLAIAAIAVSGAGLLAVRDGQDRIHCAGPATTLAPLLVAGALAAGGAGLAVVAKALLLAVVMGGASAILSHALLAARTPGPGRR